MINDAPIEYHFLSRNHWRRSLLGLLRLRIDRFLRLAGSARSAGSSLGELSCRLPLRRVRLEKLLHHRFDHRSGGTAAMARMLDNAGDGYFRMIHRRKRDEPSMVPV